MFRSLSKILPDFRIARVVRPVAASLVVSATCVGGAGADGLRAGGDGIVVVELTRLPPTPNPIDTGLCDHLLVEPATAGAAEAAALGWAVTGEVSLGGVDAVSFVGGFEPGTSGSCRLVDGNVALFVGNQLRWLAYAEKDATDLIGSIQPFEGRAIRIWSGEVLPQPVADLHVEMDANASLEPLADAETFCDGKAVVPNIYGTPILAVREELVAAGWGPLVGVRPGEQDDKHAEALKAAGIIEVDGCSPTGFGFCSFRYAGQFADLSVMTVGEGADLSTPDVVGYDVTCAVPGVDQVSENSL